MVAVGDIWFSI